MNMAYFIIGNNLRLVRNPNWPDRICDEYVVTHDADQSFINLVIEGEVLKLPTYKKLSDLPLNFTPDLLTPKLDQVEALALFNDAASKAAITGQRIGQVLFDALSTRSQIVYIDGTWYLSDLITVVDTFYYDEDLESVSLKFFQQFVN
jgi:hypothetical protein